MLGKQDRREKKPREGTCSGRVPGARLPMGALGANCTSVFDLRARWLGPQAPASQSSTCCGSSPERCNPPGTASSPHLWVTQSSRPGQSSEDSYLAQLQESMQMLKEAHQMGERTPGDLGRAAAVSLQRQF